MAAEVGTMGEATANGRSYVVRQVAPDGDAAWEAVARDGGTVVGRAYGGNAGVALLRAVRGEFRPARVAVDRDDLLGLLDDIRRWAECFADEHLTEELKGGEAMRWVFALNDNRDLCERLMGCYDRLRAALGLRGRA